MINFIKKHYTFNKKVQKKENNIKYFTPLLNEWNNDIYNFNKNKLLKNIYIKDSIIQKLLKSYFNIKKITFLNKKFSITTVFIGKQYISHINNKINITLCVYNKEKIYFKKFIYNLYKKTINVKGTLKKTVYLCNKSFFKIPKENNNNVNLILKYKIFYILIVKYLLKRYRILFFFKKRIIKLKFMNYKYNVNNFLGIKNILYKIYSKEIEFNIINLKYLYLDSNILNEAIGAKLKNRKNPLLKNIMKSIALVKIPRTNYSKLNNLYIHSNKDIQLIKEYIYVSTQKSSIALLSLKHKYIRGVKVQGSGRLTARLTALRSVSKVKQKGSLQNIYSSYNNISSIMLLGYLKSSLQYIKKNYNNRNGSYGIKTYINTI